MRFLTTAFLVGLITIPLTAQTAAQEKQALVQQFVGMILRDLQVEPLVAGVAQAYSRSHEARSPELETRVQEIVRKDYGSRDFLERTLAAILQESLTAEDLRGLIAFHGTPAGRKAVPAMLNLQARLIEASANALREDITASLEDSGFFDLPRMRRTAADMRSIATAVEAYATDHNDYPRARDITDLARFVSPTYIRSMPEKDGWGTPFLYVISENQQQYRIVSGGADRRIDFANEQQQLFDEKPGQQRIADDRGADLVYQNGAFLQIPRGISGSAPPRPPAPPRALPPGVQRIGGAIRAPRVIHRVDPSYPPDARAARVQGIVIVEVIVDETGMVREAHVLKGLPYGLEQAALDAVRQWRFEPATKDGQPVAVAMNLTINFRLE